MNVCMYAFHNVLYLKQALQSVGLSILRSSDLGLGEYEQHAVTMFKQVCMYVRMYEELLW